MPLKHNSIICRKSRILVEFYVELLNSTTKTSLTTKTTTTPSNNPTTISNNKHPLKSPLSEGWAMVESEVVMWVMMGRYKVGDYLLEYPILLLQPVGQYFHILTSISVAFL